MNEIGEFIAEGMKKYKQASAVLVSFGKEMESRLQLILSNRSYEDWGKFKPNETKKTRSTKYWSQYPLFNAKINGIIDGNESTITIDINWYDSDSDYPFYSAWIEPNNVYEKEITEFGWKDGVSSYHNGIILYPNENDFDLERDIKILLDELVRFLGEK